jgi:3-dehydroshikimate dehydratase
MFNSSIPGQRSFGPAGYNPCAMSDVNLPLSSCIRPGLVSVTFRRLPLKRVVAIASRSSLEFIEWGGDVHVPHGNLSAARQARRVCADHHVRISAYTSYYCAVSTAPSQPSFEQVLETAVELGAPVIRIWAGELGADRADAEYRQRVGNDISRACALSAQQGLSVSLEYHPGTLADTAESTRQLLQAVGASNLLTNWQPRVGAPVAEGLAEIEALRADLGNIHVFHWSSDAQTRLPLRAGDAEWEAYLRAVASDPRRRPRQRVASLEFVKDDDESQLVEDAAALRAILDRPAVIT